MTNNLTNQLADLMYDFNVLDYFKYLKNFKTVDIFDKRQGDIYSLNPLIIDEYRSIFYNINQDLKKSMSWLTKDYQLYEIKLYPLTDYLNTLDDFYDKLDFVLDFMLLNIDNIRLIESLQNILTKLLYGEEVSLSYIKGRLGYKTYPLLKSEHLKMLHDTSFEHIDMLFQKIDDKEQESKQIISHIKKPHSSQFKEKRGLTLATDYLLETLGYIQTKNNKLHIRNRIKPLINLLGNDMTQVYKNKKIVVSQKEIYLKHSEFILKNELGVIFTEQPNSSAYKQITDFSDLNYALDKFYYKYFTEHEREYQLLFYPYARTDNFFNKLEFDELDMIKQLSKSCYDIAESRGMVDAYILCDTKDNNFNERFITHILNQKS